MSLKDFALKPVPNKQIIKFIEEGNHEKVLLHNIMLLYKISLSYVGKGEHQEELVQVGAMGIMNAIGRYRPDKGAFTTYASHWIKRHMRELFRASNIITISSAMVIILSKLSKFAVRLEREPTLQEVMDEFEVTKDAAKRYLFERNKKVVNDEPLYKLTGPEESPDFAKEIGLVLHVLDDRERLIVTKRFGLDGEDTETLELVSKRTRLSRERVRQIEHASLRKMKNELIGMGIEN